MSLRQYLSFEVVSLVEDVICAAWWLSLHNGHEAVASDFLIEITSPIGIGELYATMVSLLYMVDLNEPGIYQTDVSWQLVLMA